MSNPTIYEWPPSIVPSAQLFHAPGQVYEGGFTSSGAEVLSPDPGGRAYLEMSFNTAKSVLNARLLSWLFSKLESGSIFRVPVFYGVQLVPSDAIPADPLLLPTYAEVGVPWQDNAGGEVLWGDDVGWGVEFTRAPVIGSALEGARQFTVDMSGLGQIILPGHVIGYADRSYMVDAIDYAEDGSGYATITVNPPLRTDVAADSDYSLTLRPYMIVRAKNPESFRQMYDQGRWVKPGNLTFMEVLL